MTSAWIDCSAGVAGDMLLAALVDAGAALPAVRDAVEAVVPGEVVLSCEQVRRAGLRATHITVTPARESHPHRAWHDVRDLLTHAELPRPVRDNAIAVFARLAEAEARVHGTTVDEVHFHEVGAWDSVADIVGTCAALHDLAVTDLTAGPIALGSGRVHTAHGELPVPAPAVAELAAGWQVFAGGSGELATPTGLAAVTTLARTCTDLPPIRLHTTGVGAGTRDTPGRPNVVRVLIGTPEVSPDEVFLLESNIDDLDPRAWPSVLSSLLDSGAHDAWLVPILMKKGRPAHTLCVLSPADRVDALRDAVFHLTSTLGVRELPLRRTTLSRGWAHVTVHGARIPIKIGHRNGTIVQATPEFTPAAELAAALNLPVRTILTTATTAAHNTGLTPGASLGSLGITLST
ncbi:nickel pincer cofactor biosynthesis protein LarC [Yinghuangia sp. YIM S10712]|uniref:nickel pincer cofactor biosynthesis protein LarC n=1 Tax=Yinghuangia sp. YIM S10712 TaxID=3436930 RepID=UPI003F52EF73